MSDQDIYRQLIGNEWPEQSRLPEWIGMVEQQIDERKAKAERLQNEIDMLEQRGDPSDTQRASMEVVQEEINALSQRLAALQQQASQPDLLAATDPNLVIGGIAQVAQAGGLSLELRTRPSLDSGIIDRHPAGEQVTILYGPEFVDGHTWWRVRRIDGREGWIASDGLEGRPA